MKQLLHILDALPGLLSWLLQLLCIGGALACLGYALLSLPTGKALPYLIYVILLIGIALLADFYTNFNNKPSTK